MWRGAVANLDELEPPQALTGPVARGDLETVRRNVAALEGATRELYSRLGLEALRLSRDKGLDAETAASIEAELRGSLTGGAEQE